MHWESSDGWSDWSTVAWHRAALVEAQTMNCRQRASAQHDHDIHLNLARPLCYLFYKVCVCVWCKNNTNGLIFILGESDVMEVLNLLLAAEVEGMSYFQFLPTVKWEERWSLVQYPVLFVRVSPAKIMLAVLKARKKKPWLRRVGVSRLQGCQVLLFFYNIVWSVLFLTRCIE